MTEAARASRLEVLLKRWNSTMLESSSAIADDLWSEGETAGAGGQMYSFNSIGQVFNSLMCKRGWVRNDVCHGSGGRGPCLIQTNEIAR